MSDNIDKRQDDAPMWGASTRVTLTIEPEAGRMLHELMARLSPALRLIWYTTSERVNYY